MTPEERAAKEAKMAQIRLEKKRERARAAWRREHAKPKPSPNRKYISVEECLSIFNARRIEMLERFFGLHGHPRMSMDAVAKEIGVSMSTVRNNIFLARKMLLKRFGEGAALLGMPGGVEQGRAERQELLLKQIATLEAENNRLLKREAERKTKRGEFDAPADGGATMADERQLDGELAERRRILREDYETALETEVKVRREDGMEVTPELRPPQRRYVRLRSELRKGKGQVKVVEVKPRQYGSTWVKSACFALDLINYPGTRLLIVADDKAKGEHVARDYVHAVLLSIDERLRPEVSNFRMKSNGEAFKLGNGSVCIVGTANRAAQLAKSYTMHFGLFTEVATWCIKMGNSKRADEALLACMQCFPDPTVCNFVAIDVESTAYGQGGLFADTYRRATREGGDNDGWTPHFASWVEVPKYSVTDPAYGWSLDKEKLIEQYRETLDKKIAAALKIDDFETNLVVEADDLTWGNILWRRLYGLPKCQGDPYQFQQEYPSNHIEAFQFSGAPVFSPHSITHFEALAKKKGFYPVEILVKSPTLFEIAKVEGRASDFELYKMPDPACAYFIGGDVALGSASMYGDDRSMNKRPRNDATVASIWEQETGEQVLEFVGYPDPEEFGDIMYRLALIYNRAVVNPERNTYGNETIKRIYGQLRYENVFMYINESYEGQGRAVPGMPIHVTTRTMVLDKFRVAVKQKVAKPRSLGLLREMAEVQKDDITGRIDHPRQGSDDRIFAASHAWWAMTDAQLRLSGDTIAVEDDFVENPLGLPVAWTPGSRIGPRGGQPRDSVLDPWR